MKQKSYLWPLGLATVFCLGITVGIFMPSGETSLTRTEGRDKINRLLDLLESQYLDGVNADSLMQDVVYGIVNQLDPHSVYYSDQDKKTLEEQYTGSYNGVGIEYIMVNDTAVVIATQPNSPARNSGMKHGDRIVGVDDWTWKAGEGPRMSNLISGELNSTVKLEFIDRNNRRMQAKLKRKLLTLPSVSHVQYLSDDIFYIKIDEFSETTYKDFMAEVKKMSKTAGVRLVLDLRNNGGGLVNQAIQIADEFLSKGAKILRIENRDKQFEDIYANSGGALVSSELFVLIDENSASSSEILAGALQDNDRAVIVGRRSFGKGLIQNDFQFEDGTSIRLTTNRYYTPSGRSIQKPYSKDYDMYNQDINERFLRGEMYQKDSLMVNDSLQFKTVGGRTVYGGGGIVPDVFVGLEGNSSDDGVVFLGKSPYMSHFVYKLIKSNPQMYEWSLETIDLYTSNNPELLREFEAYLMDTVFEEIDLSNSEFLLHYITAELGRQLLNEQTSNTILLRKDPMIEVVRNYNK